MPLHRARLRISEYNNLRKVRTHKRERALQMVSLSLTSMVDVFAILVIFLLANKTTVSNWLEVAREIEVPTATHSELLKEAPTLQITSNAILLDGQAPVPLDSPPEKIEAVFAALRQKAASVPALNLVGQRDLPFGTVRSLLEAGKKAGFEDLHLVVQPKS